MIDSFFSYEMTHDGDPNGFVKAPPGALCYDVSSLDVWVKTTGVTRNTGWIVVVGGIGGSTSFNPSSLTNGQYKGDLLTGYTAREEIAAGFHVMIADSPDSLGFYIGMPTPNSVAERPIGLAVSSGEQDDEIIVLTRGFVCFTAFASSFSLNLPIYARASGAMSNTATPGSGNLAIPIGRLVNDETGTIFVDFTTENYTVNP